MALARSREQRVPCEEELPVTLLAVEVNPEEAPTSCVAMRKAWERTRLFADARAPVLITGETGTGKEVFARAIHRAGCRRAGPFVAVACGAIPGELAESQLFGHEKGAFTGALQRRGGCFERADGGTLLLDDVDDLPLDIQVKLLRVLQDGTYSRVGGEVELSADVRIIATAKVELGLRVRDRAFRDDLYYRLRGLEIHLPPLRDRGDDALLLAEHFLGVVAAARGECPKTLSAGASMALLAHSWPGNVRELMRVIEAVSVLCAGPTVEVEHLPRDVRTSPCCSCCSPVTLALDGVEQLDLAALVRSVEDTAIRWALERAGGRQAQAAELLGLPRTSFQSKLQRVRRG